MSSQCLGGGGVQSVQSGSEGGKWSSHGMRESEGAVRV